jgi:hypothetical protein
MIKDGQVRELLRLLSTGKRLAFAARKTGMDEKTARKYREAKQLPSQGIAPRQWRTRRDPFAEVWPQVEQRLEAEPELRAITLFHQLQGQAAGQFPDSQRRTFERKVRTWRATRGPNQKVMFAQVHHPGDLAASDFTHMDSLGVTLGGQPFPHLIYHFVLTYSNWESITLCPSESFEALSEGLQNALWELGGVPRRHRSDSLSAAVNNLSQEREFHQRYRDLLKHYGLEGQRINVRQPHENGDAESSHGHFKDAVDQALRLRGSRDFADREEYLRFLRELVAARNARRQNRFLEELAAARPLPARRVESTRRLTDIVVGAGSTIRVLRNTYSVHSRLIGRKVDVVIGVEEVEVWHAGIVVQRMPRLPGAGKHAINYRHIIDSLVRKPGAFANYQYHEDLFPTSHFRMAYDALCRQHADKRAVREYLKILQLAARESEAAVQDALRAALARGDAISSAAIQAAVERSQQVPAVTEVQVEATDLRLFDALLDHNYMEVESHEFSVGQEVLVSAFTEQAVAATACAADIPAGERLAAGPVSGAGADIERGVEGAVSRASLADVPRALPDAGRAGGAGVVEPPAVPCGADAAGMPDPARTSHPASAGTIPAAAGEELGELRLEADSAASGPASGEPERRRVPGPAGEPAGLRQAGLGQDALRVCAGRAVGRAGPCNAVHNLRAAGAEPAGGEAGLAVTEGDQATLAVRRSDPRRPRLRAARPGGDGGVVHLVGRTLRARQRAADEQPAVLQVGADLQGLHDDSRSHRPPGASLRDLGVERAKLSIGECPEEPPIIFPDLTWSPGSMIATCTREF